MARSALIVVAALVAVPAVALAHNTPYAWTVAKAGVQLTSNATVALPAAQKAQLEGDIKAQMAGLQALLLRAQQDRDAWQLTGAYNNYLTRFRDALTKVRDGLTIEVVDCKGQGAALKGKRYKHFRCAATSATLEIPAVELTPGSGDLPTPVEKDPTVVGPFAATFVVHVLAASRCLSQRVG